MRLHLKPGMIKAFPGSRSLTLRDQHPPNKIFGLIRCVIPVLPEFKLAPHYFPLDFILILRQKRWITAQQRVQHDTCVALSKMLLTYQQTICHTSLCTLFDRLLAPRIFLCPLGSACAAEMVCFWLH